MKLFLLLNLLTVNSFSLILSINENFLDNQGHIICLKKIIDSQVFAQARPIFTNAFLKAYEHIPDAEFSYINSTLYSNFTREEYLSKFFQDDEYGTFVSHKNFYVVGAFKQEQLIGYVSFDQSKSADEVYIRQLVVDTNHWNNGIGSKLIFAISKILPQTSCLTLVTRRKNDCSRIFYKKLGFSECEECIPSEWDPNYWISYKKKL